MKHEKEFYFEGYEVPEILKETAYQIMRRFTIFGICDGMYIANCIADDSGLGNGANHFNGKTEITNAEDTADYLQRAYACNIHEDEIPELCQIINTGKLDKEKAIYGLRRFIKERIEEKRTCDFWRIDYLNMVITEAKNTVKEME